MSEQLQLRSGSYSQVIGAAPAQAEVWVDTTYNRMCVGDGMTNGGWPAAPEVRKPISDAAYAAAGTDRLIAYTAITAARVVTLPAAANYPPGARLMIVDESGACSSSNTITVSVNSTPGTDKIDGQVSAVISSPYGYVGMESNGSNAWTVIESQSTVAQAPNGASIQFFVTEILSPTLSGASVTLASAIPANCIVFAVGAYVKTTITGSGLTSFNVGDQASQGDSNAGGGRFGACSLTAGSTNAGLIGPAGFYTVATNILLTPVGGASFTGGQVRISIHYAVMNPSNS